MKRDEIDPQPDHTTVMVHDRFWWTLVGIGMITVVSGLLQCVMPRLLLQTVAPDVTAASEHFLTITGVLTASFGALLVHALITAQPQHVAVLWTGIQKVLTASAVGFAISDKIFSPLALAAAGFDMVGGVMIVAFWFWIKQQAKQSQVSS
jgi:uncharacterized protein YjeT (DUF2065 family)